MKEKFCLFFLHFSVFSCSYRISSESRLLCRSCPTWFRRSLWSVQESLAWPASRHVWKKVWSPPASRAARTSGVCGDIRWFEQQAVILIKRQLFHCYGLLFHFRRHQFQDILTSTSRWSSTAPKRWWPSATFLHRLIFLTTCITPRWCSMSASTPRPLNCCRTYTSRLVISIKRNILLGHIISLSWKLEAFWNIVFTIVFTNVDE